MEKLFVVGDIHGCVKKLEMVLSQIEIDKRRDTLIFLGDYIDRGPDSWEVVERLLLLEKELSRVVFLKGNHEQLLLDYLFQQEREAFLANGGQMTIRSYLAAAARGGGRKNNQAGRQGKRNLSLPESHLQFFLSLKSYYETEDFLFVHAGLRPGIPPHEQENIDLCWIRDEFIDYQGVFPKTVIFGHTVFTEPYWGHDRIGIDTGAVYGGKLTCLELPSQKIYQF
jgi:serine/threonine protein phosphatase 1